MRFGNHDLIRNAPHQVPVNDMPLPSCELQSALHYPNHQINMQQARTALSERVCGLNLLFTLSQIYAHWYC